MANQFTTKPFARDEDGRCIAFVNEEIPNEESEPDDQIHLLAVLEKLILWLSRPYCRGGLIPSSKALGIRTLAFLFVVRPDLLDNMSAVELSRRNGLHRSTLTHVISQFRNSFGDIKHRGMRNQEARRNMKEAATRTRARRQGEMDSPRPIIAACPRRAR